MDMIVPETRRLPSRAAPLDTVTADLLKLLTAEINELECIDVAIEHGAHDPRLNAFLKTRREDVAAQIAQLEPVLRRRLHARTPFDPVEPW